MASPDESGRPRSSSTRSGWPARAATSPAVRVVAVRRSISWGPARSSQRPHRLHLVGVVLDEQDPQGQAGRLVGRLGPADRCRRAGRRRQRAGGAVHLPADDLAVGAREKRTPTRSDRGRTVVERWPVPRRRGLRKAPAHGQGEQRAIVVPGRRHGRFHRAQRPLRDDPGVVAAQAPVEGTAGDRVDVLDEAPVGAPGAARGGTEVEAGALRVAGLDALDDVDLGGQRAGASSPSIVHGARRRLSAPVAITVRPRLNRNPIARSAASLDPPHAGECRPNDPLRDRGTT